MAQITTRETAGTGATVAGVPLTNAQIDTNFINLNNDIATRLPLTGGTLTGQLTVPANFTVQPEASGEGGQIILQKGTLQTTLNGDVVLDTLGSAFRVFENGGSFRQIFFNLTSGAITGNGISISIDGNAATVTNGVYTTGNQTIAGNKTFTGITNLGGGSTFIDNPSAQNAWFSTPAYGVNQGDNRTHFGYTTATAGVYFNYIRGTKTFAAGAFEVEGVLTNANNQVLHAGNVNTYALPITGGTLTGNTTIATTEPVLLLKDTNNSGTGVGQTGWISFQDSTNTERAWIGYGSSGSTDFGISNNRGNITINGNIALTAGNYSSYSLPLSGGTLTGTLLTNIGGGAASSTKHINLTNGSGYEIFMLPRAGSGSYNPLVSSGDAVIGFSAGAIDTGALTIGAWSNTSVGLRLARTGATTLNTFYGTTQLQDNVGLVLNGNYTDGLYSHRLRKFDDGGGVPLYIQYTMATAGTWANLVRFGPNAADSSFFRSFGSARIDGELTVATGDSSQVRINSPSGTQSLWVRAGYDADGTATPLASPLNVIFQSSGSSAGTFSFVTGNSRTLSISASAVNSLVSLQQSGNQVLHAGNYSSYALPITGGTLTGQLNIGTSTNLSFGSQTRQMINLWGTQYGIGIQSSTTYFRSDSRFSWHRGGSHNDNENNPGGGTTAMTLDASSGLYVSGLIRAPQITAGGSTNTDVQFGVQGSSHVVGTVHYGGTMGTVNSWSSRLTSGSGTHTLNVSRYVVNRDGYGSQPLIDANLGLITLGQQVRVNGGIEQGNNLARPLAEWSSTSATGMVYFELPGVSPTNYGMVHMVFDIYEYNSNSVSTVVVGGHNWQSAWYNVGANVIGLTDKPVRLGIRGGKYVVCFGTASSSWTYATVLLRKIHNAAFYDNIIDMAATFAAGITTSESLTWDSGDLRALRTPATFNAVGAITQNGNQVLHAGNFSSYALPLTGGTLTGVLYLTDTTNGISKSGGRLSVRSESVDDVANFASYGLYLPKTAQTAGLYVESPIEARGGLRMGSGASNGTITVGADTSVTANRLVQRDGNGYIYANHINFNTSESENPTISSFITSNGDGWSRKSSLAHVKNSIRGVADGTWGINITGNAATVTNGVYTNTGGLVYTRSGISTNSTNFNTITTAGTYSVGGNGTWTGSSNGPTSSYPFGLLEVFTDASNIVTQRFVTHTNSETWIRSKFNASDWQSWRIALTSTNYTSYAVATNGSSWTPHPSSFRNSSWNYFYTDFGYISFGPANATWAHIYSDKSFYFNQGIWINDNRVLDAGNYNSYSPTLTGGGASGIWGIHVTGGAQGLTRAGDLDGSGDYSYAVRTVWDGTYWRLRGYSGGRSGTTFHAETRAGYADSAGSAGSVAWTNVSGRPTAVSSFTNDSGYVTSGGSVYASRTLSQPDGPRNLSDRNPNWSPRSVIYDFVGAGTTGTGGNYAGVMTYSPWDGTTSSTGDASYQLAFGSTAANGGGVPQLRIRKGIDTTWNSWTDILTSSNFSSYALPLTGGTITGSITVNNNITAGQGVYFSQNGQGVNGASTLRVNGDITAARGNGTSGVIYLGNSGSTYVYYDGANYFMPSGQLDVNGSRVLNAGNYTSYSPTLTGGGASGTWSISISGTAANASAIDNVPFNNSNSGNPVSAPNSLDSNGIGYVTGVSLLGQTDGALYSQAFSSAWQHQIYGDYRTGQIAIRGENNGTWQAWRTVLDSSNFNSYSPTLTGGGASGTWAINISGTAAAASSVAWTNVSGRPTAVSSFSNDSGYITSSGSISGSAGSLSSNASYMVDRGNVSEANVNSATSNGFYIQNNAGDSDGLLVFNPGGSLGPFQFHAKYTGLLRFRNRTDSANWTAWKTVLHDANYTSYSPTLTGSGASGTWSINVTGSAGSVAWTNVSGRPTTLSSFTNDTNFIASTTTVTITSSAASLIIGNWGGVLRGYLYNDSSGFGFLNNSGNWAAYVPFGTTNFQVIGNLTANGNVTAYSDERLKKDWSDLSTDFVAKLAQVKAGTYTRTDKDLKQVGVSAQSLQPLLPEAIQDDGNYLSVSYGNAALAATVYLAREVVDLRKELQELKDLVRSLLTKE